MNDCINLQTRPGRKARKDAVSEFSDLHATSVRRRIKYGERPTNMRRNDECVKDKSNLMIPKYDTHFNLNDIFKCKFYQEFLSNFWN